MKLTKIFALASFCFLGATSVSALADEPTCNSGVDFPGQYCRYTNNPHYGWIPTNPPSAGAINHFCGDSSCPVTSREAGYNYECLPGSQQQQFNNPIIIWSCQ